MISRMMSWNSSKQLETGLRQKATQLQKDEESILDDFIACQLCQLPYHERVMAKMEISNVLYSCLLQTNQSANPAYLTGGFLAQEQRGHDMPQVYSHTNRELKQQTFLRSRTPTGSHWSNYVHTAHVMTSARSGHRRQNGTFQVEGRTPGLEV